MEELIMEIWKDIKGYEGDYQVSNIGRVKRLDGLTNGKRIRKQKGRIMKVLLNDSGYYRVMLSKNGIHKRFKVARLVAFTFYDKNINSKLTVNHKDFNKTNDTIENLEIITRSQNVKHAHNNRKLNKITIEMFNNKERFIFNSKRELSLFIKREKDYITKIMHQKRNKIIFKGVQYTIRKENYENI
jgi:hypothetical protein